MLSILSLGNDLLDKLWQVVILIFLSFLYTLLCRHGVPSVPRIWFDPYIVFNPPTLRLFSVFFCLIYNVSIISADVVRQGAGYLEYFVAAAHSTARVKLRSCNFSRC